MWQVASCYALDPLTRRSVHHGLFIRPLTADPSGLTALCCIKEAQETRLQCQRGLTDSREHRAFGKLCPPYETTCGTKATVAIARTTIAMAEAIMTTRYSYD